MSTITTRRPRETPCAHGVEGDGRRIRAAGRAHEVGLRALGPGLELLGRGGAERVGGADHDARAGLVQLVGELADRRRLAGAVDAHDEDHGGLGAQVERAALERLRQPLGDDALQLVAQLLGGVQAARGGLGLERLHDLDRRGHAHVGRDQELLEALPDAVVVGIEGELVQPLRERAAGAAQVLAQAREKAAAALFRLRGTLGRGREPEQDLLPGHEC